MASSKSPKKLADLFGDTEPLQALVLTLSDRAFAGTYEDKSGALAEETLATFFADRDIPSHIERKVLPDNADSLKAELLNAASAGIDIVVTTGGTGLGPRDITPDVVLDVAEKTIPGLMDHIRLKYGAEKPAALLSRSVAAVIGDKTLVLALPGSPRAVEEYLREIAGVLEHLLAVIRDAAQH